MKKLVGVVTATQLLISSHVRNFFGQPQRDRKHFNIVANAGLTSSPELDIENVVIVVESIQIVSVSTQKDNWK